MVQQFLICVSSLSQKLHSYSKSGLCRVQSPVALVNLTFRISRDFLRNSRKYGLGSLKKTPHGGHFPPLPVRPGLICGQLVLILQSNPIRKINLPAQWCCHIFRFGNEITYSHFSTHPHSLRYTYMLTWNTLWTCKIFTVHTMNNAYNISILAINNVDHVQHTCNPCRWQYLQHIYNIIYNAHNYILVVLHRFSSRFAKTFSLSYKKMNF